MRTRTALAAVAVISLLLVAAVQLADPQFDEREPPEVDFSEPPAEVATDAATQFEYVDYAYRIDFWDDRRGTWEQFIVTRVDHSNRRFRTAGPVGDRGAVMYSTDAVSYVRPGPGEAWQVVGTKGTEYPAELVTQPLLAESLRGVNATVVSETASNVTMEINDNPTKFGGPDPANATLVIDKRSGLIESAIVSLDGPAGAYHIRFQLTQTDISVERPRTVPISPRAIFWDLVRGPVFGLY